MFAVAGVSFSKLLPEDPRERIFGVPNRWVHASAMAAFCVLVEIVLNQAGALTWEYPWWSARFPLLVWLLGYMPFFVVAFWVHDMPTVRRQARTVGALLGGVITVMIVFGSLGWI